MCGLLDPLEISCLATFVDNGVNIVNCLIMRKQKDSETVKQKGLYVNNSEEIVQAMK